MNNNSTKYEYGQVNSKLIKIDPEYQRALDTNRVKRIVSNFNPDLVNPIKVNFRENKYFCFDGQHTLASLKMKNGNSDSLVDCKVYFDQTREWESKMFAEQTGIARQVDSLAKLKALYVGKDIDVMEFRDVTETTGIRMDFTKGSANNKIVACATAYKIFNSTPQSDYLEILRIIKETWDGVPESFMKQILIGISEFHQKYKGQYKRALLIKQLSRVSPIAIIRDADLYKNEKMHRYCNQIVRIYNKNTRTSRLND